MIHQIKQYQGCMVDAAGPEILIVEGCPELQQSYESIHYHDGAERDDSIVLS